MLKKFFIIFFCVFIISSAFGCSNSDNKNNQKNSVNTNVSISSVCSVTSQPDSKIPAVNSPASTSGSDNTVKSKDYIPVLMYHSILTEKNNPARVAPNNFEAQMKWLYDNNYSTLTLDELYADFESRKSFPEKAVVITFDDGYSDNYTNALPILKKYNFNATIFMITGNIGQSGYLSLGQLKALNADGINIECHTVTHPYLNKISYDKQLNELKESKQALESLLGKNIYYIAYPYGEYNQDTIKALQNLGYKMAFKMSGGPVKITQSPYTLTRIYIGDSLSDFIKKVNGNG